MIYEFQTDLNVKGFIEKMKRTGLQGEIIDMNKMPDTITEADAWIRDKVVIPSLNKLH